MSLPSWLPPNIFGISTLYLDGIYEPTAADSSLLLPLSNILPRSPNHLTTLSATILAFDAAHLP